MLTEIIDRLIALLGPIAAASRERRKESDAALSASSIALNATRLYWRDLDRGEQRNPETERQLVLYWSAAAIAIRHFDPDLAIRFEDKAEYWVSPESYSEQEVMDLGLHLDDLSRAYRDQLRLRQLGRLRG